MDPITLAYIAIGTQAVGTIASANEQRKAGKAAQRQYAAEERKSEVQNVRSVRQQIREARLAQANNDLNSADTLGIVCETIATNQEGFIITVGQLEGINTTGSLQSETWSDFSRTTNYP